jgi:hypothetical protein
MTIASPIAAQSRCRIGYSTVTDFARFRG